MTNNKFGYDVHKRYSQIAVLGEAGRVCQRDKFVHRPEILKEYLCQVAKGTPVAFETLGFEVKERGPNHITAYSNWFWVDFVAIGKDERTLGADLKDPGAGVFLYLSVDDVDEFHKYLRSKKIKPVTKPQGQPWGNAGSSSATLTGII